jgi:hypothetical protein
MSNPTTTPGQAQRQHGRRVSATVNTARSRAAAVLALLAGLGFGLPCVYAIVYFARYGQVWTFMGFPTYGEGLFEDAGIPTTIPLLLAFQLVCVAEVVMGWLLWRQRRSGVVVALALLPVELAFWLGFLLPLGLVFGAARTVIVLSLLSPARRGSSLHGAGPTASMRGAALLTWLYAANFGIPAIPVAIYLNQHGTLPWFGDYFPMYAGPWFYRLTIGEFTATLMASLVIALIATWTAALMWRGSRRGTLAHLALLPVEALFWYGFALPFPWLIGLARVTLIAMSWRALRRRPSMSPPAGSLTHRVPDEP